MKDEETVCTWTYINHTWKEVLGPCRLISIGNIVCVGRVVPDNSYAKWNQLKFYM